MTPFPCTNCGCCCRPTAVLRALGMPIGADGFCANLGQRGDGTTYCKVYSDRPKHCRITVQDHGQVAKLCNLMMEAEGMPKEWRVKL